MCVMACTAGMCMATSHAPHQPPSPRIHQTPLGTHKSVCSTDAPMPAIRAGAVRSTRRLTVDAIGKISSKCQGVLPCHLPPAVTLTHGAAPAPDPRGRGSCWPERTHCCAGSNPHPHPHPRVLKLRAQVARAPRYFATVQQCGTAPSEAAVRHHVVGELLGAPPHGLVPKLGVEGPILAQADLSVETERGKKPSLGDGESVR